MKKQFLSILAAGLMLGNMPQINAMDPGAIINFTAQCAAAAASHIRGAQIAHERNVEWNEIYRQYTRETPTFKVYRSGKYTAQGVYTPDGESQLFNITITDSISNNEKNEQKSVYIVDPRKACNGQYGAYLTDQLNHCVTEHAKKITPQSHLVIE